MEYLLDIHTHTTASGHAYSTLQEMIVAAKIKGLKLLGISDHSPGMPGSAYIYHFQNLRVVPREVDGLQLMMGVEANIIDYLGNIDMSPENLHGLEYVIASIHPPTFKAGSVLQNTGAVIGAMGNPRVNIIGHPDDARFKVDYEAIVKAAKKNHVLLELNNGSLNPDGYRVGAALNSKMILNLCKKYEQPIILGSDAHISYDICNFKYCLALIEEVEFPKELIMNTSIIKLQEFLDSKKD